MPKKVIVGVLLFMFVLGNDMEVVAAPKEMPDGTIFDAEFYADMYSDVKAVYGMDEAALYSHYCTFGRNEGRKPCADSKVNVPTEFDAKYYAQKYPDVVAVYGDSETALYKHYIECGKKEGRACNANDSAVKSKVEYTPISEEAKERILFTYRAWLKSAKNHEFYYTEDTDEAHFDAYWRCVIKHVNLGHTEEMVNKNRNLVDFFENELFGKGYCLNHLEEAREYGWVSPDYQVK